MAERTPEEIRDEYGISEKDFATLREGFQPKAFRERMKVLEDKEKRLAVVEPELESLKRGPTVKKAFEEVGKVNWDELTPLERQAAERFEDYGDEDKLLAFIESNKLPTLESQETAAGKETPTAGEVAEASRRSSGDSAASKATVTPAEVAEWSDEQFDKFSTEHPELMDKVLAGESVVVGAL